MEVNKVKIGETAEEYFEGKNWWCLDSLRETRTDIDPGNGSVLDLTLVSRKISAYCEMRFIRWLIQSSDEFNEKNKKDKISTSRTSAVKGGLLSQPITAAAGFRMLLLLGLIINVCSATWWCWLVEEVLKGWRCLSEVCDDGSLSLVCESELRDEIFDSCWTPCWMWCSFSFLMFIFLDITVRPQQVFSSSCLVFHSFICVWECGWNRYPGVVSEFRLIVF